MCEQCKEIAEKAIRQGTGFRVTPGEAAKLKEIVFQIDELFHQLKELEKKRVSWWEEQLFLAGFPEGEYQFLLAEGVIVRKDPVDVGNNFDELEELVNELYERWRGGLPE